MLRRPWRWPSALTLLAVWTGAPASSTGPPEGDPDDIPVVGRPADLPFSGASGRFEVSASATPTTLPALTPLTFTVTVRAVGPVRHAPRRIDLRRVPAFAKAFFIEDPPAAPRTPTPTTRDGQPTWQFVYRLKPRRTNVTEVPSLPFVFYNPAIRPADKAFQVSYTEHIPLTVRPQEVVAVPLQAPASAFGLATGPAVLARWQPWRPSLPLVVAALLAPPLLCAGWYVAWRRLYPDAARRAEVRRSRAARQALEALRGAARLADAAQAERVADAVTTYLRQRFDLAAAEPTPAEAVAHLRERGCPAPLAEQAADLFRACAEVRFRPAPVALSTDLPEEAVGLVLALEAPPCPPPS